MKTVQLLLPDNLHHQLQSKATEAGFDLSTYMLALLAEGAAPRTSFPTVSTPAPPPVRPPVSLPPEPAPSRSVPAPYTHAPGSTKGPQSNMSVLIRWDLIGKGDPERIRLESAASTFVQTLHRLWKGFGDESLAQLTRFKVSRGPIFSSDPQRDFVNRVSGEVYQHRPFPETKLFVRTHSSTDEKIRDLEDLITYLHQPSALLEIKKHLKS
jgi:hypothetical protein